MARFKNLNDTRKKSTLTTNDAPKREPYTINKIRQVRLREPENRRHVPTLGD